jgi:hypothetical protein
LESICFGDVPARTTYELGGEDAFDALLGIHGGAPSRLVLAGSLSTGDDDHYVRLHVASALVSPESGISLLRALQTAPSREYRLPYAGEGDDFSGSEIKEPDLELLGWLDNIEVHWEGLDDHDPVGTTLADDRIIPARDFIALHGLKADETGCLFRSSSGDVVVRIEIWDDGAGPGEQHDVASSSQGHRTWVSTDAVLRYLEHRQRDLIIEATVHMFGRSRPGQSSKKKEDEYGEYGYDQSQIYLLRQDGTLETIQRRRRPWAADHQ